MATSTGRPPWLLLNCAVQNYAWGKKGESSAVARFKSSSDDFKVDLEQRYAELWMGTHKKGPSTILAPAELRGQSLKDWLAENTWALGNCVGDDNGLPFLFKVLSIAKPLSIQAHPTKAHAQQLHALFPDKYPDPNHKPEMAIALSEFEAFCGFRRIADVVRALEAVPELRSVVGEPAAAALVRLHREGVADASPQARAALKACFTAYVHCDDDTFRTQLASLIAKLRSQQPVATTGEEGKRAEEGGGGWWGAAEGRLLLRLEGDFPGDVGCMAVYFLNHLRLQPGEALFLAPNEPHAYLSGECVECMACSDNVVRAGLTPKFRDRATLCEMLTYAARGPRDNLFSPRPHPFLPGVQVFDPPVPEFAVLWLDFTMTSTTSTTTTTSPPPTTTTASSTTSTTATATITQLELPPVDGPSIVMVLRGSLQLTAIGGEGRGGGGRGGEGESSSVEVSAGCVLFLPAGTACAVKNLTRPASDCLVCQAYCDQRTAA